MNVVCIWSDVGRSRLNLMQLHRYVNTCDTVWYSLSISVLVWHVLRLSLIHHLRFRPVHNHAVTRLFPIGSLFRDRMINYIVLVSDENNKMILYPISCLWTSRPSSSSIFVFIAISLRTLNLSLEVQHNKIQIYQKHTQKRFFHWLSVARNRDLSRFYSFFMIHCSKI
jgi:hypothetical protein